MHILSRNNLLVILKKYFCIFIRDSEKYVNPFFCF